MELMIMDIFSELQPKCSECGTPLKKEVLFGPSTGGTIESLPTGSASANYVSSYYVDPPNQGFRIFCSNCGKTNYFKSFDDLRKSEVDDSVE
jgi:uncharacterized protein (DUF983 family)